ncbi:hypothetical protein B0T16DRAFT_453245 [Cercophora newfieldiana]|uniref:Uncharacterized protein n=1 Tax=Cercophora newfieldiana TaxID=92897 RepID=A0AA40D112_9PEZI|nr:hypothetical protein B0T16DRAFT_453245 [Cercophora newfieldiana]
MRAVLQSYLPLAKAAARRNFITTPSYVPSAATLESPCVWHRVFGGVLSRRIRASAMSYDSQEQGLPLPWKFWGTLSRPVEEADDSIVAVSGEVKGNPTESEADVAADRSDDDPLPPGLHHKIGMPAGDAAGKPTQSEERVKADRSHDDPLHKLTHD